MRDMVACFSDHAIRVSETTCSSSTYATTNQPQPPPPNPTAIAPASQTSATSLYKLAISATKHLLITVTWTHHSLTITSGDDPSTAIFKLSTLPSPSKKKQKKGVKSIHVDGSNIEVLWDLSEANYGAGAEPRDGYYVVIMVDTKPGLVLGDLQKLEGGASMVCRREEYRGGGFYCTRVRFREGGGVHEIGIRVGEEGLEREPWMAVSVDRRRVMRVKNLQWNFRGNGMIWVEGVMVDVYWDLYEWLEEEGSGVGVFMFRRRRCGVGKKVWLQKKMEMEKEEDDGGCEDFSLMIYASKS